MRHAPLLWVTALVLTGCQLPFGTSNTATKASLHLTLGSVTKLTSPAHYRVLDTVSNPYLNDFTPTGFRAKILHIRLTGSQNGVVTVYEGKQKLELADQAQVENVINEEAIAVPEGTYTGAEIRLDGELEIKGEAFLNGQTYYTKAEHTADATQAPAEFTTYSPNGTIEAGIRFPSPLTVKAGDNVKLSMFYDLTEAALFSIGQQGSGFQYANGAHMEPKYIPFFAFIGTPPVLENYQIKLEHRLDTMLADDPNWHFHLYLFPMENGELSALHSMGRIDDGFAGNSFQALDFVSAALERQSRNGDGTYHLVGWQGDMPYPSYEVLNFQRASHSGTVKFYPKNSSGATPSAPIDLTYQAIKL